MRISGFNSACLIGRATVQAGSRRSLTAEIRVECEEADVEFVVNKVTTGLVAP
jgi:hypothetical protein